MNISKMIWIAVMVIVIFILIMIMRIPMIPIRDYLGLRSLPPYAIMRKIDDLFAQYSAVIFFGILIIIGFFYLIYLFVKKVLGRIPIIGKIFVRVMMAMPPFRELDRAGLFSLLDTILFQVVFSGRGGFDRLKILGQALGNFGKKNINNVRSLFSPYVKPLSITTPDFERKDDPSTDPTAIAENLKNQELVADQYERCLQENLQPINNNMSKSDINAANLNNITVQTQCQAQKVANMIQQITNMRPS